MERKPVFYLAVGILIGIFLALVITIVFFPNTNGPGLSYKMMSPTGIQVSDSQDMVSNRPAILLPAPNHAETLTLDEALKNRRSVREFRNASVSLEDISSVTWAAQGITNISEGKRTAPSAMKTYPLTIYLVARNVDGIPPGVYSYAPSNHSLVASLDINGSTRVLNTLGQKTALSGAASIVITGNITPFRKFGPDMANQSMYLESGHVAQNILLELTTRDLGGVPFTGFNATNVGSALGLRENERVLYAIAFGVPV